MYAYYNHSLHKKPNNINVIVTKHKNQIMKQSMM